MGKKINFSELTKLRKLSLKYFSKLMNDYHKQKYSDSYYDVLAGNWVDSFVDNVYLATLQKKKILKTKKVPLFFDLEKYFEDFKKNLLFFNHLNVCVYKIKKNKFNINQIKYESDLQNFSIGNQFTLNEYIKNLFFFKQDIVFSSVYHKTNKLKFYKFFVDNNKVLSHKNFFYKVNLSCFIDKISRLKLMNRIINPKSIKEIIFFLMPLYIPLVFFESFEIYKKKLFKKYKIIPKILFSSNDIYANIHFKIIAAESIIRGGKVYTMQHGGGFGIINRNYTEIYAKRVSSLFYSWGFKGKKINERISVPFVQLKISKDNPYILLVNNNYYRGFQHCSSAKDVDLNKIDKSKNIIFFVKNFKCKEKLLIRPPKYLINDIYLNLKEIVKLDRNFNINDSYLKSKIVVHSYLGTSFLETIALNIPTICFFNKNEYEFTKRFKNYLHFFVKKKIFHHSPKSAVHYINNNEESFVKLWSSKEIQDKLKAFKKEFCRFDIQWEKNWKKEINKIINYK